MRAKRLIAFALSAVMLLQSAAAAVSSAVNEDSPLINDSASPPVAGEISYIALGPVEDVLIPESEIILPAHTYSSAYGVTLLDGYLDIKETVVSMYDGHVTYTVEIPRDGRYCILISYAALPGSRANIELSIEIDGVVPFREAQVNRFKRSWRYAEEERSFDNMGNMLRPFSEEVFIWQEQYFSDKEGYFIEPFAFNLAAGTREITLRSVREPVVLSEIRLTPPPHLISYAELFASYNPEDIAAADTVTVLAVDSSVRNSPSLLPIVDLTNPFLEPFSLSTISYNVMGGDMWCQPGQMIAWEMEVPSDGLYSLSFVYKQDAVVGLPVTRTLAINGEIPFAEARTIVFPYSSNWERMAVSADDEDALFYFTEGKHEISLTVTLGPTADICRRVSEISSELSAIYTQIIMVTGPYPDNMRDYRIDERLPHIMPKFAELAALLDEVSEDISALGGGRNDALSISIMASQLHDFVMRPDSIPGRLPRFKDNITNLAIWILIASEMPLTLYSLSIAPPDTEFPPVRPGFFRSIWFAIQRFFASFTSRAENAGNSYDDTEQDLIEVWGMYGKDASELLKRLIDERFTPETGIKVNYNIIFNENLMFFNIAAGTGPDVCISIAKGYPLDFGLRESAVDLTLMPDYEEFESRFTPTSMLPNSWDGRVYGFPVVQQLPVMFVRTDIFRDLNLPIPETWDDFYSVIGTLGVNNLQVSPAGDLMPLFVLQNGGEYFNEDLSATVLDDPIGIAAITEWTNLFTLHGAPVVSDFFNRFRTGEMPIGINDYSLYNMLDYAALEIKGNWAMYPVPGVRQSDGTIDRTIITSAGAWPLIASTSGFITTSRPSRTENAWEFVRWFMSEEIQVIFALELEAMFGPSARYNTANVEALKSIPWDRHSLDTIMTSLENVRELPGVPGAYFITRHITNAFNEIVLSGETPRAAMRKYAEVINSEIMRKRIELGLEG
ncbi:MAG: extracellular solute-binding protein [Oscillospiraceae bacterium]|jgi:ABC-type glycerol-3-phosphate transport system substrate-binding protein|nr:extracellular solute-binding protein [Oscillospiraceae bacterium]